MIVPHKPCPWCGTVKHIYRTGDESGLCFVYCDNCGCNGPVVSYCRKTDAQIDAECWTKWDESHGTEWQDYEVPE